MDKDGLKPGVIYRATIYGVEDVLCHYLSSVEEFMSFDRVKDLEGRVRTFHKLEFVTEVRELILIDPKTNCRIQ